VREQTATDKQIIDQNVKAVKKAVGEKGIAQSKISQLTNDTLHIENKTQSLEVELTNDIAAKTQSQVDKEEEKNIEVALEQKEVALTTKLVSDVQKEVAEITTSHLHETKIKVVEDTKKNKATIDTEKKKIADLTKKEKEVASKPTTDPKSKSNEIAKISEQVEKANEKIKEVTDKITNDEATVTELEVTSKAEKTKADALETQAKAQEKIYTSTIGSNKEKETVELEDVKSKNLKAKEASRAATKASDEVKNTQQKVIDSTNSKIKTCESKK